MIARESIKEDLFGHTDEAVSQLRALISPLNNDEVNRVPYRDSWTAAQLFSHVTKSMELMASALGAPGKRVERDPALRVPELKQAFLDFSQKFKTADVIAPDTGVLEKRAVTPNLASAYERLKTNASVADLADEVSDLPLGPVTKLEILHFVLYHTQRHLHQMTKITDALRSS